MGITLDKVSAACGSSVKISDGTNELAIDGSGFITANINGTVTVTATDLDIRDLSAAQDNVAISDGTDTMAVNADGSINSVVTATDLDVRDLTHVSDSVKIGDGTDFLAVNADGSINVNASFDLLNTAWQVNKLTVTTTSSQLDATPLAAREKVIVQNLGPQSVFLKNTTATVNDLELPCGASMELAMTDALALHAITAAGTADVRLAEFK